jgi:Alternative complex III, ActD subunit
MHPQHAQNTVYGLMAEFADVTSLVTAAQRATAAGYKKVDAYTPFPVHELFDALDAHDRRLPLIVLLAGISGALAGFGLCYWVSAIAYPLNIGGRPLNSWPSFIPVTFEVTILFAAFTAVIGMIVLNGLPMPYHPVFNVRRFAQTASQEGLFLAIEAGDPKFDREKTRTFLQGLGAKEINEIEP